MAENKTKPTNKSVVQFLDTISNDVVKRDGKIIVKMMKKITGNKAVMWGPSIIGFGAHFLKYESGRTTELPIISFSPRKNQFVLYVLNNFKNQTEMLKNLGKHKTGKLCLYIKKLSDINISILEQIISNSYNKEKTINR